MIDPYQNQIPVTKQKIPGPHYAIWKLYVIFRDMDGHKILQLFMLISNCFCWRSCWCGTCASALRASTTTLATRSSKRTTSGWRRRSTPSWSWCAARATCRTAARPTAWKRCRARTFCTRAAPTSCCGAAAVDGGRASVPSANACSALGCTCAATRRAAPPSACAPAPASPACAPTRSRPPRLCDSCSTQPPASLSVPAARPSAHPRFCCSSSLPPSAAQARENVRFFCSQLYTSSNSFCILLLPKKVVSSEFRSPN